MIRKKLIESVMPAAAINREAEREKNARGGLSSGVHLWWSRRSPAAARCTLFASLADDPGEHPELFPTEADRERERQRLIKLTADLAAAENAADETLLEKVRRELRRYAEGELPTVFDPFAGSGVIPVEAHRLGLNTEAADLNGVAALITGVVSDLPGRFAGRPPVHPEECGSADNFRSGAGSWAEDVRWYGERIQAEAFKRLGRLYPPVKDPETEREPEVNAWIWTRTVQCPNPYCGCLIPLSSSYDLSRKKGAEVWVEPWADEGKLRFHIRRGARAEAEGKPKVAHTAVFKCPFCGGITTDAYVKECGRAHKISSLLLAVAADDGKRRLYFEPDAEQLAAAEVLPPRNVPPGTLPVFPARFSPPSFGLTAYADLFTNRQLVYLTTMLELAAAAQAEIEERALAEGFAGDGIGWTEGGSGALAYAQAVRTVLVLTVSRLLERCSGLCSWDAGGSGNMRSVFARAAMPMIWDYAEGNPFGNGAGSFLKALDRTCAALACLPAGAEGHTQAADCTRPNAVRNALLSTDLPYYDRADYADLADFFYVWLRMGLGDLYPEWFKTELSPKREELTAFACRWDGDREQARSFYAEGLNRAFACLRGSVGPEYPASVTFFYKVNDSGGSEALTEWETFVTAVCGAGFMITASWPLGRKYEGSLQLAEAKGIPLTVVLRLRPDDAPQTTRRGFVSALKRELPGIVGGLKRRVGIMDLRPSAVGQALRIYSRYGRVLDADGTLMKPYLASRIIEQELDTVLTAMYAEIHDGREENCHGDKP